MHMNILKSLSAAFPSLHWQITASKGLQATSLAALRSLKTTTGIVGLPVDEHARENYKNILADLLDALKVIPPDAEYRLSVERTVNHKLDALKTDKSDEELEDMFGFQLEQGIKMCKEELALVPKMAEWKPWDVPEGYKVEIVEQTDVEAAVAAAPPPPPPPPPK